MLKDGRREDDVTREHRLAWEAFMAQDEACAQGVGRYEDWCEAVRRLERAKAAVDAIRSDGGSNG